MEEKKQIHTETASSIHATTAPEVVPEKVSSDQTNTNPAANVSSTAATSAQPQPAPASSNSNNTVIAVVAGVVVTMVLLTCCCCGSFAMIGALEDSSNSYEYDWDSGTYIYE